MRFDPRPGRLDTVFTEYHARLCDSASQDLQADERPPFLRDAQSRGQWNAISELENFRIAVGGLHRSRIRQCEGRSTGTVPIFLSPDQLTFDEVASILLLFNTEPRNTNGVGFALRTCHMICAKKHMGVCVEFLTPT